MGGRNNRPKGERGYSASIAVVLVISKTSAPAGGRTTPGERVGVFTYATDIESDGRSDIELQHSETIGVRLRYGLWKWRSTRDLRRNISDVKGACFDPSIRSIA